DPERQIGVALAMYDGPGHSVVPLSVGHSLPEWARKLQVLVAFLRTANAEITFPEEIKALMQQKHEELRQINEEMIDQLPWLSDFQSRLANSVFKFAAAYARMNNRQTPTTEDVDHVFRLIWRKFEFLSTLASHLQIPKSWELPQGLDMEDWL